MNGAKCATVRRAYRPVVGVGAVFGTISEAIGVSDERPGQEMRRLRRYSGARERALSLHRMSSGRTTSVHLSEPVMHSGPCKEQGGARALCGRMAVYRRVVVLGYSLLTCYCRECCLRYAALSIAAREPAEIARGFVTLGALQLMAHRPTQRAADRALRRLERRQARWMRAPWGRAPWA